jgi:hypothetical protein
MADMEKKKLHARLLIKTVGIPEEDSLKYIGALLGASLSLNA